MSSEKGAESLVHLDDLKHVRHIAHQNCQSYVLEIFFDLVNVVAGIHDHFLYARAGKELK